MEVSVATRDVDCSAELLPSQTLGQEGSLGEVPQKGELDLNTQPGQDEIVRLGDGDLGCDEWVRLGTQEPGNRFMLWVQAICLCIQCSGIQD